MIEHKETKKTKKVFSIVAIIIAVIVIVAVTIIGLFFYHAISTRNYCNNYANKQSKTAEWPEEVSPAYNDQCLRKRGFGSF
jgi:flagellar basal body-associated protein FliL